MKSKKLVTNSETFLKSQNIHFAHKEMFDANMQDKFFLKKLEH